MEELTFDQLFFLRNTMHPHEYTITRVGLLPILLRDVFISFYKNNTMSKSVIQEYYIMGIDRGCGLLSDFGGHCNLMNIEIPINCLYRELNEEMGNDLTKYFKSKIADDDVRKISRIFTIKNPEDMSMKIQIFLKFSDDNFVIDNLIDNFRSNEEISSIGYYDKNDVLKTSPPDYIRSVELFMIELLNTK